MNMCEHAVAYSSEACKSILQLAVQSMGKHVSILICNLPWFTLRSLAFIQDASVLYCPMFGKDKCVIDM